MDWTPRQIFLALDESSFKSFEYEADAALPLTVIQGFGLGVDGKVEIERIELHDSDDHPRTDGSSQDAKDAKDTKREDGGEKLKVSSSRSLGT